MMKKKFFFSILSGMILSAGADTVLLDNPSDMNCTVKGDPASTWVVRRSRIVPAKPNTW